MADWKLLIEDDAGKTIVVPLVRDTITIGRKEGNTIRLTERNVSRFHARLEKLSGQVFIEDLESYNGIKINGDRIKGRVEIREGDLIEIGDYHLALQAEGAVEPVLAGAKQPEPTSVGSSLEAATQEIDDEFAGDTQRWEPPASMEPLPLGAPTTEEPAGASLADLDLGETARFAPAPAADAEPTMEERRPQERVPAGLDAQLALDQPTSPIEALPEVTLKSPSAPHALAPGLVDADAETEALPPSPALAPAVPTAPGAIPPMSPAASGFAARNVADDERTEAVAPAPGGDRHLHTPRLVALNTVFAGTVFPIHGDEVVVGRTEENDLTIQHKSVSRSHCKLVREGDRIRIFDLKSANGILVNGEEHEHKLLNSGDVIELGRVRLRFVPEGEPFELSSEEIERARVADAAGEEWTDEGTFVTSPVRDRVAGTGANGRSRAPVLVIAAAGGALLLAVVAFLLFGGSSSDSDEPHADPTGAAVEPKPLTPEASKYLAQGRSYLEEGRWDDAVTAFQAADDAGAGDVARKELLRAQGERKAEGILVDVKHAYEAKDWEKVRRLTDTVPTDYRAYPEAKKYADDATKFLANNLYDAAKNHLRAKRVDSAADASDRLRELEGESGRVRELEHAIARLEEDGDGSLRRPPRRNGKRSRSAGSPSGSRRDDARPTDPEPDRPSPEEVAARVNAYETEANQLLFRGDTSGAIKRLKEAQKLAPGRPTLHRLFTLAYRNQGDLSRARSHFEKYKRLNPTAHDLDQLEASLR